MRRTRLLAKETRNFELVSWVLAPACDVVATRREIKPGILNGVLGAPGAPHAETIDMINLSIRVKIDLRQAAKLLLVIWLLLTR